MKVSEYIKHLQEIQKNEGDIDVKKLSNYEIAIDPQKPKLIPIGLRGGDDGSGKERLIYSDNSEAHKVRTVILI